VRIRHIGLADYLAIAAEITGLGPTALMRVARLGLAEPALHAPAASFGDTEFYPDFIDKAAALIVHLAKNYPLPDGNKRTAWVTLRLFIEINEWTRRTTQASTRPSRPSCRGRRSPVRSRPAPWGGSPLFKPFWASLIWRAEAVMKGENRDFCLFLPKQRSEAAAADSQPASTTAIKVE
jgi:death-on-curing protein